MMLDIFRRQNHEALGHVNRLHPVSRCGKNNYTKSGDGPDGAISNDDLGETTERLYKIQSTVDEKL